MKQTRTDKNELGQISTNNQHALNQATLKTLTQNGFPFKGPDVSSNKAYCKTPKVPPIKMPNPYNVPNCEAGNLSRSTKILTSLSRNVDYLEVKA